MSTRLYRSQRDKKIFGLCGGIAEAYNIDVTVLRLIAVVMAVFSAGTVIFLYIVASLVIPKEPVYYGMPPGAGADPNRWDNGPRGAYGHQTPPPPPPPPTEPFKATPSSASTTVPQQPSSNIDDMMKDVEKKAMLKEIEELKQRLAKLEKGE